MADVFFALFQVLAMRAPQKVSLLLSGAGEGGAAAAVNVWLVTLTKARQQTNTPNTHTLSPHITGVVWFMVFSELSWKSDTYHNSENKRFCRLLGFF